MRKIFYLLLLLSNISNAQVDSLKYYFEKNDFQKTIIYGEMLMEAFNENIFPKNQKFIYTINYLLLSYQNNESFDKLEKYSNILEENLELLTNENDLIHNYFILSYNYKVLKNYSKSEFYISKTIDISEKSKIYSKYYFYSLVYLGDIRYTFNEIYNDNTKKIFIKQVEVSQQIFGKNSNEHLISLNNLGNFYISVYNYDKAEDCFLKILNELESNQVFNQEIYTAVLNSLSNLNFKIGNISKSDYYNEKLARVSKNDKERLNYLANKISVLDKLGLKNSLGEYYLESIKLSELINGRDSEQTSILISNYGAFWVDQRDFVKAKHYLEQSIKINDSNNKPFANVNNFLHLANIESNLSKYKEALLLSFKAVELIKSNGEINGIKHAKALTSISNSYYFLNELELAEKYQLEAYSILLNDNSSTNFDFLVRIENLLSLNSKKKLNNINNEINYFLEILNLKNKIFSETYSGGFTEYELNSFNNRYLKNDIYFSLFSDDINPYDKINIKLFEYHILYKNLTLRNQQRIKTTIEKNGDVILKEKYQAYIDNKRYITKMEELPLAQRPASFEPLKIETENLEKELTRLSSAFAESKKSLSISWKQIQEKLKPNEAVVDLVSFNYYNKKWTDSTQYAAFVIKKDSKFPKFISLFEEKQLAVLLERNNQAHDSIQANIIDWQYSNQAISDLFYKPLENELKDVTTVYFTPSSLAHQINFKALPINTHQSFGEKFNLILLGATASLIDYKPTTFNKTNNFDIFLYGGIDYDKKEAEILKDTFPNALNDLATRSGIKEFGYLKGTVEEINKIHREANKNHFKTTIKTERDATEESVKQLSGRANPFILHLATHGYFFENIKQELSDFDKNIPEDAKKRIYLASEDPMLRSGLLLAGANNYWRKTNNEVNTDDGILTAKEISNLDLSACELVVLSACETGLGQINGSEGVFGLQRAFKMAGAKNIIMSLWKVPDAQTAELFEIFYREYFRGVSVPKALQLAQNQMKTKYSPYYWAGFVLLE
jgi:CHAT domain-containing protein/tetratricopeptide (TPR) repeat protein